MSKAGSLEIRKSQRYDIELTVFGLGGGGSSRLGVPAGRSEKVLAAAAKSGIGYIDTAEVYGTEEAIGRALSLWSVPPVVSSKLSYLRVDGSFKTEREIEASLRGTLARLQLQTLDIYFVHGVLPEDYNRVRTEVFPLLEGFRDRGLIRAVGVSEMFNKDPAHRMLVQAVADGVWDFLMTGCNLLNRSAVDTVIPGAATAGTGVIVMFAVRNALRSWESLEESLSSLGWLDPERRRRLSAMREAWGENLPALAYRYVRDIPGVVSVLGGTSDPGHLRDNVVSLCGPPLTQQQYAMVTELFRDLPLITGQ